MSSDSSLLDQGIALARAAALPPTATATAFVQFCIEAMGGAPAPSHPS